MPVVMMSQRKHLPMMKHCLRYMIGRQCCVWKSDFPERPCELVILTDADRASESECKWIANWVHIYHGGHGLTYR